LRGSLHAHKHSRWTTSTHECASTQTHAHKRNLKNKTNNQSHTKLIELTMTTHNTQHTTHNTQRVRTESEARTKASKNTCCEPRNKGNIKQQSKGKYLLPKCH
jgi:hypothetical protein